MSNNPSTRNFTGPPSINNPKFAAVSKTAKNSEVPYRISKLSNSVNLKDKVSNGSQEQDEIGAEVVSA